MYSIQKATTEFLQHCRYEKNLSPKTIKSYSIDLKQLSNFLTEKNYSLEITDITKNELREFLELISSLKPKSIKRKIATIKAMFNFLEFDDRIEINPFRKMRIKIKEPKTLPKVMDIKEIKKIFNTAYEKHSLSVNESEYKFFESLRDIVVIELLFATGARVSEIANLKVNSIDVQNGMVTIRGKGNKERIIQICNPETLHLLKNYHKRYLKEIEKSGGFFLINRLGKMLSDQSIRVIVKKLACRAKLKKHITPHVFRHSFATLLLEKDVDIKYIQSLLGHSSIMTTQIYTHVNRAQQKKILKTKHPRKDFSMLALLVS
ncbi:MAG TPA: integrase [Ignavibacteria bacterium]|nr:integrase [Ignavibacteria bacterium]